MHACLVTRDGEVEVEQDEEERGDACIEEGAVPLRHELGARVEDLVPPRHLLAEGEGFWEPGEPGGHREPVELAVHRTWFDPFFGSSILPLRVLFFFFCCYVIVVVSSHVEGDQVGCHEWNWGLLEDH